MASSAHQQHATTQPASPALIGRIPFFIRQRLGFLSKSRVRYNDLVNLRFGGSTYLLTSPPDIKYVLTTNAANYVKTPHLVSEEGRQRSGDGLITSMGAAHHAQRQLLSPAYRRQAVSAYGGVITERVERLTATWTPGVEIDIAAAMADLSQSVILGVLFGDEFREYEPELTRAIRARRRYTEYYYHSRLPWHTRLPTRTVRQYARAMQTIDKTIYAAIASRRGRAAEFEDLTAALMNASYPDGTRMSDERVRNELMPVTVTGYETVGDGLSWAWYLLARYPDVQTKLLEELSSVLGGRTPTAADVPNLAYTEMVFMEVMRLFPPTWIYVRVPVEQDTLPSGASIPANAKLYLCPYIMHRHPDYFPEPEVFDPERFRGASARKRMQYVYFPLGMGRHRCIGEHLANLEAILVLAHIAPRFRFELLNSAAVKPFAGITLRPKHGIRVAVHPR